ncbi:TonB-dependent receptor domain-containing protein [Sphingomonas abietis]|uniref:TonB-dependent receptor n=1 Tax=Sphingomonas abietis TaxID=3012344 RepID=A0ABY7NQH8_9SPHN|nr:TonB-dependent receptor [Sphingomonas abietis]WBO23225.1 TonB-dependent receptor [Sphingomonas abietis]
MITAKDISLSGQSSIENVLNEMPQFIPSSTAASNNPGGGVSTADLRGLGAQRSLVLVNGHRYISYDTNQIVDLNTIPAALVQRVDVVTGGKSAVYGSDAIGGVINFVMKQNFEGLQADAGYRLTGAGDGGTFDSSVVAGHNFADNRANVTVFADYSKRKSIAQSDRKYSDTTLTDDGNGGLTAGGSSSIPAGRFTINGVSNKFTADGGYTPYNSATDAYNYAPANYLQVPLKRLMFGTQVHFDVSDHLKFYGEGQYVRTQVKNQLAPTPYTGTVEIDNDSSFLSSATQQLLQSYDTTGSGYTSAAIYRRLNEVGDRISSDDVHSYRGLFGVKGQIVGNWNYDAYVSYSRTHFVETQYGNVSNSRVLQALHTSYDSSGNLVCSDQSGGCVPLDIFGAGNISAAAAKYISVTTRNVSDITEEVASGAITNDHLFDLGLGGGYAGLAFGVEYRREHGGYDPDAELSSGDVVGFNASEGISGGYNVKEEFLELDVPLIGDKPFIDKLAVNGAYRHSDYSVSAGSVNTFSAGVVYAPIHDISFRGQYSTAVRAPTVADLYAGSAQGYYDASDPCTTAAATSNASLAASCVATGVPTSALGTAYDGGDAQIEGYSGGNSSLKAEKARTLTAGFVIQPREIRRLSLTVDYYRVNISNYITTVGVSNIMAACYGTAANGWTPYASSYCSLISRDKNSYTAVVQNNLVNSGGLHTRGVDFEGNYSIPFAFGLFGTKESNLALRLSGTRLLKFDVNPLTSIPDLVEHCSGRFGTICGNPYAKWRLNGRATWSTGPVDLSVQWRYLSPVHDDDDSTTYSVERIKAYNYFDLTAQIAAGDHFTWTFGVNNVANKQPPLLGDNQEQANTYPSTYDPYGRTFFVNVGVKL